MKEYMVERYLPDITVAELDEANQRLAAATRALVAQGVTVLYVGSTFVPGEDSCFSRFRSVSADQVRRACAQADVGFARIVETRDFPHKEE
jgi:Nickel responsive protein SCO4226-like